MSINQSYRYRAFTCQQLICMTSTGMQINQDAFASSLADSAGASRVFAYIPFN
jgi:hypothetical protein